MGAGARGAGRVWGWGVDADEGAGVDVDEGVDANAGGRLEMDGGVGFAADGGGGGRAWGGGAGGVDVEDGCSVRLEGVAILAVDAGVMCGVWCA